MRELTDVYAEHLEEALKAADRYLVLAASAALGFFTLSFAKARSDFDFTLGGFPLHMNAVLAQALLYVFSVGAFWLADHAVLHCRDLVRKLEDDKERVVAVMSYPTILTLGPMRSAVTILPSLLIMLGVANIWRLAEWSFGSKWLNELVLIFAAALGLGGVGVWVHTERYLKKWFLDTKRPATPEN